MSRRSRTKCYVVCLNNRGYKASLEKRKLYEKLPDSDAETRGLVRVIDESGEDYLFPDRLFASIDLPKDLQQRLTT